MIRINASLAACAAAAFAFQLALPAHAQKTAAASKDDLLRSVEQTRADDNKKFDDRKKEYDGITAEAQKNAKMKEATDNKRCARQGVEEAPGPVLRQRGQDQPAERSAARQGDGARSRRAVRSRPTGLQRRLLDPPAVVDHDAVPGRAGRKVARRVPAVVLRLAHDADGGGIAESVDRDSTRDDREPAKSRNIKRRSCSRAASRQKAEVIRIGPFTAISGGKFLSYLPTLRTFEVLPRQLPGRFMSVASRFSSATSGYAEAVVDSARGVLLGLYVERPDVR